MPGTGAARAQCGKLFHPARLACPATALRRDQHGPGAQSPRPAPAPPPAGASPPPGRALAFRCTRTCRSGWHRPARAGETRCVSCSRPDGRQHLHRFIGRGHHPCHSAALPLARPGAQSPRPAPAPPPAGASPPAGRAPASVLPGTDGRQETVPRGRGNATRVSGSRPKGQSLAPDREELPAGRRSDCCFSSLSGCCLSKPEQACDPTPDDRQTWDADGKRPPRARRV